jgi:hypothetical protein
MKKKFESRRFEDDIIGTTSIVHAKSGLDFNLKYTGCVRDCGLH